MQIPDNIDRVLKLNSTNEDKVARARQKIIAIHFSDSNTNTEAFSEMAGHIHPHAIEWIGRDLIGFSLLYHVSRGVLVSKLFEWKYVSGEKVNVRVWITIPFMVQLDVSLFI